MRTLTTITKRWLPKDGRFSADGFWLLRGSFWMLIGRVAFGAAVILQNMVLARALGPADFGAVLLAQSLMLPAALISVGGLDLLAIRELRAPGRNAQPGKTSPASFMAAGALLIALVSLAIFAVLAGGLWLACDAGVKALTCETAGLLAPVLWPLIVLFALQLLAAGVLRALGHVVEAAFLASVLATYVLLGGTALALVTHVDLSIQSVLVIQACGLAAGVGFSLRSLARIDGIASGERASILHLARSGPALMLTQLLALLVSQSDVLVAGLHGSPEAVAQYGVAARLSQLVSLPHLVLGGVLPPLMASSLSEGRHRHLEAITQLSVTLAVVPALTLGIGFWVFGRDLLTVAFGAFYGPSAPILAILALGNVVNVLCGPCSHALILSGHERTLNLITGLNCILCIGGGALASLWFGNIGLAAVYALGLSLQGIVASYATVRLVGIRTYAAGPVGLVRAVRSI